MVAGSEAAPISRGSPVTGPAENNVEFAYVPTNATWIEDPSWIAPTTGSHAE